MAADQAATPVNKPQAAPSVRSQRGLDWLNFFVANIETAFGPFLSVYLAQHGWSQGTIGTVLTASTAVTLATQTPAGALVDWMRRKRLVVAACLALIAAGSLLIGFFPTYLPVMGGELLHGVTGGAVQSALAAIGLGLVGHRAYHTRVGRNQRYASLGAGLTAACMGVLGAFASPRAPFFAVAGLCLPALLSLSLIDDAEVDYARARGATGRTQPGVARWHELLRDRRLLVLSLCLFLFQFANASMLPLASERLAADYQFESEVVVAALVVVPQLVTALIAAWVAHKADEWGRKWLFSAAFIALLARAVLFALAFGPWFLVGVQVLDGLSAAVVGILVPVIVADCTKGTGRYNFSLGGVNTISGLGATASTTAIGFLAQSLGFTAAFFALAAVAVAGLATVWLKVPETVHEARSAV